MSERTDCQLANLKRRLANARKRAVYWSGRPSFTARSFVPGKRGRRDSPDAEYEIAMSDVQSLADAIERLTGKRPAITDYQQEFRDRFTEGMYAASAQPQEHPQ